MQRKKMKHTRFAHWRIVALLGFIALCFPPLAFADVTLQSIMDAAQQGPGTFLAYMCIEPACSLITDVFTPMLNGMLDWGLDWLEIPYVNTIVLWLQGLAITATVIVRIWVGFKSGILQEGSNEANYSFGEYVFKTAVAIIVVGAAPTISRAVIVFGKSMFDHIQLNITSTSTADAFKWLDTSGIDYQALQGAASLNGLWVLLAIIAILLVAMICGYQFIRRQIEMLAVYLISPIVAIYSATEQSSYQILDLYKSLFGLVSQQWLQFIFVMIGFGFGQAWIANVVNFTATSSSIFQAGTDSIQQFFLCMACLITSMSLPRLIDRYTFGGGGTRMGGLVATQALITMRMGLMGRLRRR